MTIIEIVLVNTLIGVVGVGGGRLWGSRGAVNTKTCQLIHSNLGELLDTKFQALEDKLTSLERKIDNLKG